MKKILAVLTVALLTIACTATYAFATDFRSMGIWLSRDQKTGTLLDASTAVILGDAYNAYVVALSEEISEENVYGFFAPDNNSIIDLALTDYYELDSTLGFGLFKMDVLQRVTVTSIARNSADYIGDAYLQYLDVSSIEDLNEVAELSGYCQQSSVSVIDNDGVFMYLDRAPGGATMGAAIMSEDHTFIGYYYGKTEDGYCAITAEKLIECFPQLKSFCVNDASDNQTTTKMPEIPDQVQTTASAEFVFGELVSEPISETAEGTAEESKDSSKSKTILIAGLGVVLAAGIAAAVMINRKKKNDGGFMDGTGQSETTYSPTDSYTVELESPDSFHAEQPSVGETQDMESTQPTDTQMDCFSDGQVQIEDIDDNYSVGETVPLYAPPANAPQTQICIVGKGGYFDKQKIVQTGEIIIGRHPQRCTLRYPLDAKGISTVHCRLAGNGQSIEITDLGSSYGTFVNGVRLERNLPTVLHDGDTFWLADPTNSFFVVY